VPQNSECVLPFDFYDELFQDFGNVSNCPIEERHKIPNSNEHKTPDPKTLQHQKEFLENLSAVMSREWLDEAEASDDIITLPSKLRMTSCKIFGHCVDVGYDPSLRINILSMSHKPSLEESLSKSNKRLRLPDKKFLIAW